MDLSERIQKAAQQQERTRMESENKTQRTVKLGPGRKSNYGYNGVGRPTNEGYDGGDVEGDILNE